MGRVSLKDVAKEVGVSATTVSWVLSGKGNEKNISKATQNRVVKIAESMNYRANLVARSLNTGFSKTLGLVLPSISDRFFSEIAEMIEYEASKLNYSLILCNSGSEVDREYQAVQTLRSKQVDGIIIAPTKKSTKCIKELLNDDFPLVLFDRYFADLSTNYIIIDNEVSSFKLVNNIIAKGGRKVAMLTTNPHLLVLKNRADGYYRAHSEHGVQVDESLIKSVEFLNYEKDMSDALSSLFSEHPDIDGLFFTTHILAIEALVYMYKNGIDPSKFKMACIHQVSTITALAPHMSTSIMPTNAIARECVKTVIEEIDKKHKTKSCDEHDYKKAIILSSEICLRD